MRRFIGEFGITSATRILDVGGVPGYWRMLPQPPRVVILNMPRAKAEISASGGAVDGLVEEWVAADARCLPFGDRSFDIVFSNSVIEHVGDAASQEKFAREVARVGRGYWVQTPNRWFPVEPHLLTPFVHWLPRSWQRALVPHGTVWGALSSVTPEQRQFYLQHYLRDIRLLGYREMRRLFPEASLIRERFLGSTKSLVALRRPG
jgi:hypothetical protein